MLIKFKSQPLLFVIIASLFSLIACNGGNTNTAPAANESPTAQSSPTVNVTGFEADLDYIRKGGYTYIWVFSRPDGKPIDKEDAAFLRTNAPQVVDWVTTDEGRKVIAGTNFDLAQGNLGLIKKRFVAEDYTGR
ncbi:MAG: hypothetical protein QOF62_543 [Pyrinomonadaceae bacterium]|jgi:hypothetical protein|nr:hypothetical protein [Pyrinomonadaceae bacterium]